MTCWRASISAASACSSPAFRPGWASRRRARSPRTARRSSAPRAISPRRSGRPREVRAAGGEWRRPRAGRARSRLARERARLRRRAGRRRPAVRRRDRQCRRDGTPFGHTADGFETQFGTNHLGHFVLRQPHRAADRAGRPAGECRLLRPPLCRRRSRRSEFRAHALRSDGRLWPLQDRQHPVRGRVRPPPPGARRARDRGASGRHPDRTRPPYGARRARQTGRADQRRTRGRRASRRSSGRRSRRAPRPRSGPASSRRPTRSAAAIARTATWRRSPKV